MWRQSAEVGGQAADFWTREARQSLHLHNSHEHQGDKIETVKQQAETYTDRAQCILDLSARDRQANAKKFPEPQTSHKVVQSWKIIWRKGSIVSPTLPWWNTANIQKDWQRMSRVKSGRLSHSAEKKVVWEKKVKCIHQQRRWASTEFPSWSVRGKYQRSKMIRGLIFFEKGKPVK